MDIKEITKKLFEVDYEVDFENEDVYYEYLDVSENLIKNNDWVKIYDCWYDYLINNCKDDKSVLNFANLFWCYEGYKQKIYNAVEFCAFFYANINFELHPEANNLLEGLTAEIFLYSGIYTQDDLYDYIPTNDPLIINAIKQWKEKV